MTGTIVTPEDFQVCHRMKNKEKVIVKFKDRKGRNKVIFSRKEPKSKGEKIRDLQFDPSLFINDSMCFENQSLFHKCRRLKNVVTTQAFANLSLNSPHVFYFFAPAYGYDFLLENSGQLPCNSVKTGAFA